MDPLPGESNGRHDLYDLRASSRLQITFNLLQIVSGPEVTTRAVLSPACVMAETCLAPRRSWSRELPIGCEYFNQLRTDRPLN